MNICLSSLALTPSLFFIAFVAFFWGNNAHMYHPDSLAVSFLIIVAAAAVAAAIGFAVRYCWDRLGLGRYWPARLIAGLALGCGILIVLNVLFRDLLKVMFPSTFMREFFRGLIVVSGVSLCFFRLRSVVRALNCFLLASICLSAFMAASVFLKDDSGGANPPGGELSVSLKKTPNIYMFWMESFHEPKVIDRYYGTSLVRDGFPDDLMKRGFQFFEGTYATTYYTLGSMADFFSMRLNRNRDAGMHDAKPSVRRLIGGSDENRVLRILKANGYFTAYITRGASYYHGGSVGRHLDSTDFIIPAGSLRHYIRPLWELNSRRVKKWFGVSLIGMMHEADGGYSGNLKERVRHAMDLAKSNGKPLFVSFQGGAAHTSSENAWQQQDEWIPYYRDMVKNSISDAMEIMDMIVADDPDAVIILLGDHGPRRLEGILRNAAGNDLQSIKAQLRQHGESLESFVDDTFNVILAIRIPGCKEDISHGFAISTVNVFLHVLAALNDDPALLENRQPNISTLGEYALFSALGYPPFVIEGKIVQE